MRRRARAPALALPLLAAALAVLAALPAPALAHCDPGTQGSLVGPVHTCALNEPAEAALGVAHGALDGEAAVVLVKDFRFHPEVVRVKSGGTVVFVYADADWFQLHDPRSTGPCAGPGADPAAQPEGCVPHPPSAGKCFDGFVDQGGFMGQPGDVYPLTFRYDPAEGRVHKSMGVRSGAPLVGEPPLAQAFSACPPGTTVNAAGEAVLPYHCGIHGLATTAIKEMRGAIVIEAP